MAAQQQALQMQQAQQLQQAQLQAQQLGLSRISPTSPPSSPPNQEFFATFPDAASIGGTQRNATPGVQQPGMVPGLPGLPQPGQTVPLGGLAPMQFLGPGSTGVPNPYVPSLAGLPGMLAQPGATGSFASSIQGSLNNSLTGSLQGAPAAILGGAPGAAAGGLATAGAPSVRPSLEPDAGGAQQGQPVAVSMAQQLEAAQAQIASQQMQLQAQREQLHEAQVCQE